MIAKPELADRSQRSTMLAVNGDSRSGDAPAALGARLAVLRDYREESWPSMDLCADMLLAHLPAADVCPQFRRPFSQLGRRGFNADRALNRYLLYPRALRTLRERFGLFHVVDHSYAALVHALPLGHTGVFCHDLDAFRILFTPVGRRPVMRGLAARILSGMQKAAVVFHSTGAVRDELVSRELIEPARLVHAPYGVAPEFTPDGPSRRAPQGPPFIVHVGSCIPRKRIDVLLEVFAALRDSFPDLQLVKVGGDWSAAQRTLMERLRLTDSIVHLSGLPRVDLAAVYRGAAAVLLPSDAEGFGLPVIEALACGASVIASDLPVLREVGGDAAAYAPVGDVARWAEVVGGVLRGEAPNRERRLQQAARYTWCAHAQIIAAAYRDLLP